MSRIPNPGARPGGRPIASIPTVDPQQMPPPAKPIPGVTRGNPPLPVGRPVAVARNAQGQPTWQPAATPTNMQPQIVAAQQDIQRDIAASLTTPPIDPTTPPVGLNVVDVADLPPAERAKQLQNIQQAMAQQPTAAPQARPQARPAARPAPIAAPAQVAEDPINGYEGQPTIEEQIARTGQAVVTPGPMLNSMAQTVLRSKQVNVDYGNPERPAPADNFIPDPNYQPSVQQEALQSHVPDPAQAAQEFRPAEPVAAMTNCPHCQWDLTRSDTVEPKYSEKLAYLQTLGGDKPYVQRMGLIGGHLTAAFRVLSTPEIDECYRQAQREQKSGRVDSYVEFIEKVNRYRLYLQLLEVKTQSVNHGLPDGLSVETNPNATNYWDFGGGTVEEPLPLIEQWMLQNVLKNETMFRVLHQACGRFNQLVAKLEAMADTDSDFWNATAEQL